MKRRNAKRAFTIIEVIVIVVILGVLAAVIAPRLFQRVGQSKQAVARSNAAALATAVQNYRLDNGMPESGTSIEVLWARPGNIDEAAWKGPYVDSPEALKDPWDNLFILRIPGEINADFDVVSYGADGSAGGESENADIVNGQK